MSELDLEVSARTFEGSRTYPEFPLMLSTPDGDGLAGVDTVRLIEKDADGRTGRWMILPVGPHPEDPQLRAMLWPPLAANHSPNAAARRMADPAPEPVAPVEPAPDATPPVPRPPNPFDPAPGWNPWWYAASQWIARTALGYMTPTRSDRRDA